MRVNKPVTEREEPVREDERLISTTNPRGVIQSTNNAFLRVSGFSHDELVGSPHNMVRHPDMPEAVYEDFWTTLKAGKPWMGVIKNRCKNGDHYWVSGYVSPVYEGDQHVGFQSVRSPATAEQKERASRLYARIRAGRAVLKPWHRLGTRTRYALITAAVAAGAVALGYASATMPIAATVGAGVLAAAAGAGLMALATRRLDRVRKQAQSVYQNSVGEYTYGGGHDLAAQVELAMIMQRSQMDAMQTRVNTLTEELASAIASTEEAAQSNQDALASQREETDSVATAMNEMATTVQEISANANEAATAADEAAEQARSGGAVMDEANTAMTELAREVREAAEVVNNLESDTAEIRKVVDVVQAISEQTNLLALNAAIEAARAGESGRGFSVVAEEVRALSGRVKEATGEISEAIQRLESGVNQASSVMARGNTQANTVAESADTAHQATGRIQEAVASITDMNTRIASAAEEQSQVAEEINRNITGVKDGFEATEAAGRRTRETSEQLGVLAEQLKGMIRQFRVLGQD
ncbi:MAG: PAS domain-containing methyl-accepting chemotaxis protein [Ectothiorhodospiraceae bacterium]